MGVIVAPCSMKTVAGIMTGYSDNLLLRAADVCLKERRRLVLAARESELSNRLWSKVNKTAAPEKFANVYIARFCLTSILISVKYIQALLED